MHVKKHLSHNALVSDYISRVDKILDHRREASNDYEVKDVMLTALACMRTRQILNYIHGMKQRMRTRQLFIKT